MRTTLDIPEELYRQAELKATREGILVGDLVALGLRLALRETPVAGRQRIAFPLIHSARPATLGVEQVRAAEEDAAQQEDAARAGSL